MGYTTEFYGTFTLDRALDDETFDFLMKLATTRRMKRNEEMLKTMYGKDYGIEGEFFVEEETFKDSDQTIINHNTPPSTQPGLWCQWIPSEDRKSIHWDGNEKFYEAERWIEYIVDRVLAPKGYQLNGIVAARGEQYGDLWVIQIDDNEVTVQEDWHEIMFEEDPTYQQTYCLRSGSSYYLEKNQLFASNLLTSDSAWKDLYEDKLFSYRLVLYKSKEEAEQAYRAIRVRTLFATSEIIELQKITGSFVLLSRNASIRHRREGEIMPDFGLIINSSYGFENQTIIPLHENEKE